MEKEIGTRKQFRAWLKKHEYTYTEYSKKPLEQKREIYRDYQDSRKIQKGVAA